MNSLHRKLQFFSTVGGKLKVVLPEENQLLYSDTLFQIQVEGKSEQNLQVFLGDIFLGELPFVDNVASGTVSISSNLLGIGGAYFVIDDEEIPANSPANVEIIFKSGNLKGNVRVKIDSDGAFSFDRASAILKTSTDISENYSLSFDRASAEITITQ